MIIVRKMLWLGFTVSSGLSRVVIFFVLAFLFSKKELALFSVYYSFITVAVIFIGGGLGTALIKNGENINKKLFNTAFMFCLFFSIIATLFIGWPSFKLSHLDLIFFCGSLFFLCVNQLFRYFYTYFKQVVPGLVYDVLSLVFFICAAFAVKKFDLKTTPIEILFWSYMVSTVINQVYYLRLCFDKQTLGNNTSDSKKVFNIKFAINVGFVGLISTGIVFLLPYFSRLLLDDSLMSILGIAISVIGVISVFARAYMNYYYKELIDCAKNNEKKIYYKLNSKVIKISTIVCVISLIPLIFYIHITLPEISLFDVIYIVSPVLLFTLFSQFSLVQSNILLFLGRENISLLTNICIFLACLIVFLSWQFLFKEVDNRLLIPVVSLVLIIMYFLRYFYYRRVIEVCFKNG